MVWRILVIVSYFNNLRKETIAMNDKIKSLIGIIIVIGGVCAVVLFLFGLTTLVWICVAVMTGFMSIVGAFFTWFARHNKRRFRCLWCGTYVVFEKNAHIDYVNNVPAVFCQKDACQEASRNPQKIATAVQAEHLVRETRKFFFLSLYCY